MEKLSEIQVQMLRTNIRCAELLDTAQQTLDMLDSTVNALKEQQLRSLELLNK